MNDLLTSEFIRSFFNGSKMYSLTAQKFFEKAKKGEFDEDISASLRLAVMKYIDAKPGHNASIAFDEINALLHKENK